MRLLSLTVLIWLFLAATPAVFAENMSSDSYQIRFGNFNVTSGTKTSPSYSLTDTVGQTAAGPFSSPSYQAKAGFQYIYPFFRFPSLIADLYNYPATISKITSRPSLALIYFLLIAIAILLLLLLLKKRYNLILLDRDHTPISAATVTLPQIGRSYPLYLHDRGQLYLPHLTRATQLAIDVGGHFTHLCLLQRRRLYKIILG